MSKHLIKQIKAKIAQHQDDMRRLAVEDELSESMEQDYKTRIKRLEMALANERQNRCS